MTNGNWRELGGAAGLAVLLMLGACGGGGGGDSGGGSPQVERPGEGADLSGEHFVSLQVGNRWVYEVPGSGEPVVETMIGTRAVEGGVGTVVSSSDTPGADLVWIEDAQGVRQIPGPGSDALSAAIGPMRIIAYPLRIGATFKAVEKSIGTAVDFDGDGKGDAATVRAFTDVVALEKLVTPAGTLPQSLHLQSRLTVDVKLSSSGQDVSIVTWSDDWFAPGLGRVRSAVRLSGAGLPDTSYGQTVTGYSVGEQRSERVAPVASSTDLETHSTQGIGAVLRVEFTEPMDVETLPTALEVVDEQGRTVPGNVAVTGRSMTFTPSVPWSDGSYRLRVGTAAQDLLGNALAAPREWPVTIDATPPVLLWTQPAIGAVDVPPDTPIMLKFSEPLDPSTVHMWSVSILTGGIGDFHSFLVDGDTITVTAPTSLKRGVLYDVKIDGVADLFGNKVGGGHLTFNTDPGRFGLSQPLPTPDGFAGARVGTPTLGDFNGDGRLDVVQTMYLPNGGAPRTFLLLSLQRPEGGLVTGVPMDLPPGCAYVPAMGAADIDGDGRTDLVVALGSCGIQVYRQSAQGELVKDALIPHPAVDTLSMQLADMDGDGRSEVLTYSSDHVDSRVRVWRNGATGWAPVDTGVATGLSEATNFAVGDVNADGRPDVAFTGNHSMNGLQLRVMLQGGGGLEPSRTIALGVESSGRLAIGDVDGDGLNDVVVVGVYSVSGLRQTQTHELAPMTQLTVATFEGVFEGAFLLVDLNGDGRADLLGKGRRCIRVYYGQTDGTMGPLAQYDDIAIGSDSVFQGAWAVGDVTGDGRVDVVLGDRLFVQRVVPVNAQSLPPRRAASQWPVAVKAAVRSVAARRSPA
jgi:hypothetical protein